MIAVGRVRVRRAERVERDEVDRTELAGREDVVDRADDRRVLVVVRREEYAADLLRMIEERARVGGGRRDRLLAEHVEAVLERGVRDRGVVARRRRDVDKVEAAGLGGEQGLGVRVDARARQELARLVATDRAHVGDRDDLEGVPRCEVGRDVAFLGDEAEPDEGTL